MGEKNRTGRDVKRVKDVIAQCTGTHLKEASLKSKLIVLCEMRVRGSQSDVLMTCVLIEIVTQPTLCKRAFLQGFGVLKAVLTSEKAALAALERRGPYSPPWVFM